MRKSLLTALLGVALAVTPITFSTKSKAANPLPHNVPLSVAGQTQPATLPDYDLRLVDKSEFTDYDLSSTSTAAPTLASQSPALQRRRTNIDAFRATLKPSDAQKLRAVVNESGAMKMFFVDGALLTKPQSGAPDTIARGYLQRNASLFALADADVPNLKLDKEDNDEGTTFLNYFQTVAGIKVFEGEVKVAVNHSGEILSVREGFLISAEQLNANSPSGLKLKLKPSIVEEQAVAKAFEYAGRDIIPALAETRARASKSDMSSFANPLGAELEEVLSELNVVRVGDAARLAWHVYAEVGANEWYEILVDANTGELLYRRNLYVFEAQGTVFTEDPGAAARQLVSFLGDTTINTTAGWMGTSTVTTGNNVEAYLDTDANNAPDANNGTGLSNGHASAPDQNFTFPFSTAVDPRTQQAAIVTNLFYYNNIMHDFSYRLGFTEAAGNFQTNNFGRGGLANDSVRAEAQDGSGTNNANFSTPPDGQRPRMQQFLFTAPNPDRDSSVDSDVVFHEYGHGISNRLIGNGSGLGGTQSGAMGEGWSDYWATTINNDGVMGEYVVNNTTGIRRAPYTVPANPVHDSYADVGAGGFEVHNDGEVWAVTLWDLRTQLGAATTDRLVLNGMKFTPSRPSFLNARDGILQADQNLNGGVNRCAIWAVFARHGMGVSAVGNDGTTHIAATDVPADCNGGGDPCASATISPTSASQPAGGGTGSVSVTAAATCNWTAASNAAFITVTSGASGTGNGTVTYSVASNTATTTRAGTLTIAARTFTVNQAGAVSGGTERITNGGFESGTVPWTFTGQASLSTGSFPHTGTAYVVLGAANNANDTLFQQITIPTATSPNLTFWLNVTTSEAAGAQVFDRLFVEVRSTTGTLLATLATFSNQNSGTAGVYVQRGAFNLASFAGQTVRIQFRAVNDVSLPTSFRVDDVSVK